MTQLAYSKGTLRFLRANTGSVRVAESLDAPLAPDWDVAVDPTGSGAVQKVFFDIVKDVSKVILGVQTDEELNGANIPGAFYLFTEKDIEPFIAPYHVAPFCMWDLPNVNNIQIPNAVVFETRAPGLKPRYFDLLGSNQFAFSITHSIFR
jgi:hypothetical protein